MADYQGIELTEACKVYDLLRKGAVNVTCCEWVSIARIYHRGFIRTGDGGAKAACIIAMQNARICQPRKPSEPIDTKT